MRDPAPSCFARLAQPIIAVSALALLAACGNAVDSDTAARPADVAMPATDYERDETALAQTPEPEPDDCNASQVDPYIGRAADFEVRAEVLERIAPLVNVRWLAPGDEVDGEAELERLTIELDEEDVITEARCG